MKENNDALRIMRDDEVERITGLCRETRYGMTARGDFPSPVWITGRTRGYMSDEIDGWLEGRRNKRTIPQAKPWKPNAAPLTTC